MGVVERVPPQSAEAEQSVLGAMLIEREAVPRVLEVLRDDDFYHDAHRAIFQSVVRLFERNEPSDLITVQEDLRQRGLLERVGGLAYLSGLTTVVPTAANVDHYARIVQEKSLLRALIAAGTQIASQGYETSQQASTLLDEAERLIFGLGERRNAHAYRRLHDLVLEAFDRLEEAFGRQGTVTGVPTGFADLDRITAGLQPSELIVLAARPSMGKTQLMLNMARNAAVSHGIPVGIFSLEMSAEALALRLLAAESLVDSQLIRSGSLQDEDFKRIAQGLGRLGDAPIFIDDSGALTALDIRARARRLKAEQPALGMIMVDYLQLMEARGPYENRQQEISMISRSLKGLARELRIPVLAASQLSRAVEARQEKRPLLSDLRESGAIEQDADVVAFIYREQYYQPAESSGGPDVAEIIVAKQRNGPTGTVKLLFHKAYGVFAPMDVLHAEPRDVATEWTPDEAP